MIPHCDTNKQRGRASGSGSHRCTQVRDYNFGAKRRAERHPLPRLRDFVSPVPAFKLLRNYCVFLWSADARCSRLGDSCSPSSCITGGNFRTYTATRFCVSVSWLWIVHPAPKCKTGDVTSLDAKPSPWHHRARVLRVRRWPRIFHRFSTSDLRRLSS